MPTHRITAPDGSSYEVDSPEGTSDADVMSYVQRNAKMVNPAGFGASLLAGAEKPIDNIVGAAKAAMPGVVSAFDKVGSYLGMPSAGDAIAANDATRARAQPLPRTLGEISSTMLVPGGAGGKFAAGIGNAATGALLSDKTTPAGVAGDAALSAVGGHLVGSAMAGLGKLASPVLSKGLQTLRDANIPVTAGQALGGAAKGIEDKLMSVPYVGDMIKSARDQGTLGFNAAVINRALAPINEALPNGMQAGHDAIRYAGDKLSEGYNNLVPQLSATIDNPFLTANGAVLKNVQTVAPTKAKQMQNIVNDALGSRVVGGQMQGDALKAAQSKLTQQASEFKTSMDPDQRIMGRGLSDIADNFQDMLMRQNPQHAPMLESLNSGWATLVQAEKAAAKAGARNTGVFTPAQFMGAMAQADNSVRGRAISRGTARNQDLASAASSILPSSVPDSGTTGRAMLGGVGTMLAGGGAGMFMHPGAAAIPMLAAAAYSRPGQAVVNSLLAPRGPAMQFVGQGLGAFARPVGRATAAGVPSMLRPAP